VGRENAVKLFDLGTAAESKFIASDAVFAN
jgi:hypothetical protein